MVRTPSADATTPVRLLGAALGAWGAGRLGDRYGRIHVMVGAAVLSVVSAVGSGSVTGPVSLTFWRVVGGIGAGAASVVAPACIAEISPASVRGRLGSLQQLAIVVGIFLALGLEAWRWMFISAAPPGTLYGALALTIPESRRAPWCRRGSARRRARSSARSSRPASTRSPARSPPRSAPTPASPTCAARRSCFSRSSGSASCCRSSSRPSAST